MDGTDIIHTYTIVHSQYDCTNILVKNTTIYRVPIVPCIQVFHTDVTSLLRTLVWNIFHQPVLDKLWSLDKNSKASSPVCSNVVQQEQLNEGVSTNWNCEKCTAWTCCSIPMVVQSEVLWWLKTCFIPFCGTAVIHETPVCISHTSASIFLWDYIHSPSIVLPPAILMHATAALVLPQYSSLRNQFGGYYIPWWYE